VGVGGARQRSAPSSLDLTPSSFFSLCNLDLICIVNFVLAIVFLILTNDFRIESIMTLGRLNSLCIIVLNKIK
jgi:hypothetical protein